MRSLPVGYHTMACCKLLIFHILRQCNTCNKIRLQLILNAKISGVIHIPVNNADMYNYACISEHFLFEWWTIRHVLVYQKLGMVHVLIVYMYFIHWQSDNMICRYIRSTRRHLSPGATSCKISTNVREICQMSINNDSNYGIWNMVL